MLNTLQSPRYYTVFAGFDVNGDQFHFQTASAISDRNTYRGDSSYTTDVRVQRVFNVQREAQSGSQRRSLQLVQSPECQWHRHSLWRRRLFLGFSVPQEGSETASAAQPIPHSVDPNFVAPARTGTSLFYA